QEGLGREYQAGGLIDKQAAISLAQTLRLVEPDLSNELLGLQSRPRAAGFFVQVDPGRLLDAGHSLVTFIDDRRADLPHGGKPRGIDANAIAGADFRPPIDRVLMRDRVFLVESD